MPSRTAEKRRAICLGTKAHISFFGSAQHAQEYPNFGLPRRIRDRRSVLPKCDASKSAVSYILTQVQKQVDGREQEVLVACGGRALRDSETRWPPIHTEALAALLGVIAYKHYFVGRKVTVRTD